MGYTHNLTAKLTAHTSVTQEQILEALNPLLDDLGYTPEHVLAQAFVGEDRIEFDVTDEGLGVSISTSGEVGDNYLDIVYQAAENLSALCEPGFFEHHDHETEDLSSAITEVWVGEGVPLVQARREHALDQATKALRMGGYSVQEVEDLVGWMRDKSAPQAPDEPERNYDPTEIVLTLYAEMNYGDIAAIGLNREQMETLKKVGDFAWETQTEILLRMPFRIEGDEMNQRMGHRAFIVPGPKGDQSLTAVGFEAYEDGGAGDAESTALIAIDELHRAWAEGERHYYLGYGVETLSPEEVARVFGSEDQPPLNDSIRPRGA